MIEQQKRKGPELPLVPVKRQRHELLLGAAGSGPGAGQQQAAPGALLQAVSKRADGLRPSAHLPVSSVLHREIPYRPFPCTAGAERDSHQGVRAEKPVKAVNTLRCYVSPFDVSASRWSCEGALELVRDLKTGPRAFAS